MNQTVLLIILLILIFFILLYCFYYKFINKYNYYHKTNNFNFLLKNILNNNNIYHNNKKWNIYLPHGYTTLESQLNNLEINNNYSYIFGIKGCDKIVAKNFIWKILVNHYSREIASNLMPTTFVFDNNNDINLFTKDFNNNKNSIYILKKNIQRKEGLKLSNNYFDIINSKKENYKIIQKYLTNLFLINKRKINLRIYFLIINKNNKFYYYISNLGKCIYTNKDIDTNNTNYNNMDFEQNITSFNLNQNIYNKNPQSLFDLKKYLGTKNSNILFNNINLLFKKISIAIHPHLKKSCKFNNTVNFQHFGADVIFDNDFKPLLLEFNKGPDMYPKNNKDQIMKKKIYYDIFHKTNIIKNLFNNNSFYLIFNK